MDRSRFGFGELVTADTTKPGTNDDKLNLALDRVEASANERQLDHHPFGIITGLEVVENATPNMTVKVNAGAADDQLGQRIEVPSQQSVDPLTDYQGNAISLPAGGQEKYVSIFLKFKRLEQNATQDLNSVPYAQDELEYFELRVRAGAAAATGTATPPALQGSEVLLADILLTPGMTEIGTGDIKLLDRRQDAYNLTPANALPKTIRRGKIKDVVTDLLQFMNELLDGTQVIATNSVSHTNGAETFAGAVAPPTSGSLQTWLRALVTALGASTGTTGGQRIGNASLGQWADGTDAGLAGALGTQVIGIITALAAATGTAKVGGAAVSQSPTSLTAKKLSDQIIDLMTAINARARKASAETITAKYTFDLAAPGTGLETAADTSTDLAGPVNVTNKLTVDLAAPGVGIETAADTRSDFNGEVEVPRLNVGVQNAGVIAGDVQITNDVGSVFVQSPASDTVNYCLAMPVPANGNPVLHLKFYGGGAGSSRRVWITTTADIGAPPSNYFAYWEANSNARAGAVFAWDGTRWRHIVSTGLTGTTGGGTLAD